MKRWVSGLVVASLLVGCQVEERVEETSGGEAVESSVEREEIEAYEQFLDDVATYGVGPLYAAVRGYDAGLVNESSQLQQFPPLEEKEDEEQVAANTRLVGLWAYGWEMWLKAGMEPAVERVAAYLESERTASYQAFLPYIEDVPRAATTLPEPDATVSDVALFLAGADVRTEVLEEFERWHREEEGASYREEVERYESLIETFTFIQEEALEAVEPYVRAETMTAWEREMSTLDERVEASQLADDSAVRGGMRAMNDAANAWNVHREHMDTFGTLLFGWSSGWVDELEDVARQAVAESSFDD